jgi:hypothetical protein
MTMRYFEIRSPQADFTGKIGPVSFADGRAQVQFDDTRDERGMSVADELQVSPGRSLVAFARRREGYVVIELDERGQPLDVEDDKPKRRRTAKPTAGGTEQGTGTEAGTGKDGAR